jgi:hypothetical protein
MGKGVARNRSVARNFSKRGEGNKLSTPFLNKGAGRKKLLSKSPGIKEFSVRAKFVQFFNSY